MLLRPCACHLIRLDKCVDTHSKEFNILTSSTCKLTYIKKKKKVNPATQPIKWKGWVSCSLKWSVSFNSFGLKIVGRHRGRQQGWNQWKERGGSQWMWAESRQRFERPFPDQSRDFNGSRDRNYLLQFNLVSRKCPYLPVICHGFML